MNTKEKVYNLIMRDIAKVCERNKHANRNAIYSECMKVTGYCQRKCILLVKEYEQKKNSAKA